MFEIQMFKTIRFTQIAQIYADLPFALILPPNFL